MTQLTQKKEQYSLSTGFKQEQVTKANGLEIKEMDKESRYGQMVPCTLETGRIVKRPVKVNLPISTETSTMANGSTTKLTASVFMSMETEASISDLGRTISHMASVLKLGLIIPNMKEAIA